VSSSSARRCGGWPARSARCSSSAPAASAPKATIALLSQISAAVSARAAAYAQATFSLSSRILFFKQNARWSRPYTASEVVHRLCACSGSAHLLQLIQAAHYEHSVAASAESVRRPQHVPLAGGKADPRVDPVELLGEVALLGAELVLRVATGGKVIFMRPCLFRLYR
jgi:hypothetical protein